MFYIVKIIIILIYISFINCQIISLTPNADIQLIGASGNEYSRYPSQSNGNTCIFNSVFIVRDSITNRESSNYGINSNLSYVSSVSSYYINTYQTIQIQNNNNNQPQFSIDIFYDNDIQTKSSFLIQYNCIGINEDNIKVGLINNKAYYDRNGYQATFITVGGIDEYTLDTLVLSPSSYLSIRITNKLYLVFLKSISEPPVSLIEFGIKFTTKTFNFTILPSYSISMDSYQDIEYQLYPSSIISQSFQENGFYNSPMMLISSNKTFDDAYMLGKSSSTVFIPFKISTSVSNDTLLYNYIFPFSSGSSLYSLNYNNGPSITSNLTLPLTITRNTNNKIPTGNISIRSNTFTFEIDSASLGGYSFKNNIYNYEYSNQYSFSTSFPFGFSEGSLLEFNYKVDYILKSKTNSFKIYEAPQGSSLATEYYISGPTSNDYYVPIIKSYKFEYITKFKYLLRIQVSDDSGISFIKSIINSKSYGYETLIEGSNLNGTFEIVVDILSGVSISIYDESGTSLQLNQGSIAYLDDNNIPIFFNTPSILNYDNTMINNISFLENNINITNQENYNILYFNTSEPIKSDTPVQLILYDDISYKSDQISLSSYSIYWDDSLKKYYAPFVVPKNSNPNEISYSLCFSAYSQLNGYLFNLPLNVSSTNFDNDGPMIISIENSIDNGSKVGWKFIIQDSQNGFNSGYVKVVGSVDGSIFKFNFTLNDSTTTTNPLSTDPLEFNLIIDIATPCITQNYQIVQIHLLDLNGRESQFMLYGSISTTVVYKNPLRYLLDQPELLITESICSSTLDSSAPFLISFNASRLTVDVGSLDRLVSFNFTCQDEESGLMPTQHPIVYLLSSSDFKLLECESTITSIDTLYHQANYYCEIIIPVGFSSPGSQIQLSLYSLINNNGLFRGYATSDLESNGFTSSLSIELTLNQPIILDYEKYLYCSTELILYGRILKDITGAKIQLSNGQLQDIVIKSIIGSSVIKIDLNSSPYCQQQQQQQESFKIRLSTKDNIYSNWFIINPTYYKANIPITPTNTPSTTPILPTNKPQKCLGNPICGGKDHGYCNENQGCICYSPWIGTDCLSKVIIIPQPSINDTHPTIEIPVITDNNEIDNAVYRSLISLVSLRELDINNNPINSYQFDKWLFTLINSSTSQYFTNITTTTNDGIEKLVNITTTIVWFENETLIEFANQSLTMNPSSIKYTIEITNYPFKSKLNKLQLVMSASIISSKSNNICSSIEFGDTTSGDNSNYLQLSIENKSLYGRFIKRGIINNNGISIISLDNEILDSQMNSISKPNQIESYIGITIPPWYEGTSLIIDPDFSVLLNPNSPSSNSICTSNNKLSSTKIAGIVIGSVSFIILIIIISIYMIYKKRKDQLFINSFNNKLKSFNK